MSLNLLRKWSAYARLTGGLGQPRHDWNAAMVASTIANAIMATHTKSGRRLKISDLIFRPTGEQAGITDPREIYRALRDAAIKGMGAKDPKVSA